METGLVIHDAAPLTQSVRSPQPGLLSLVPEPPSSFRPIVAGASPSDTLKSLDADTLEVLVGWQAWLDASFAPRTATYYWRTAFRYLCAVPKPLDAHTEADIAGWLETFPFRSSARRTYYGALLSLFKWAKRNGHIPTNPAGKIRIATPSQKVPRALTEEQYEAVKAAAFKHSPVRGYTVELLYYSAGRITEVLNLKWTDCTDEGIVFRKTKNGNERLIPWSEGLRRAVSGLRSFFGEQERVLPRSAQTVGTWLNVAGRAAGVEGVHPHLFRSTAATRMLVNGARPHAVKDVLGHSKITTTQVYWAVEHGDKAEAVGML